MTVLTPFLKLQKPPFDDIPWDEAVNGNMDIIDSFISRYMAVPNYVGAWLNSTLYTSGQNVLDISTATIYLCGVTHTSSAVPTTFAQDRVTYPTYWHATTNVVTSGGGATISVGDATPSSPKQGDLWFETTSAQLYVLYNDGNSFQWVIATNQPGNIGDASSDGLTYGRQNAAWVPTISAASPVFTGNPTAPTPTYGDNDTSVATTAFVQAAVAPAINDVGRNKIHNSMFTVAQRGVGTTWSVIGYTLDRWYFEFALDASNVTHVTANDTMRSAIGDEHVTYVLGFSVTGNSGATAYTEYHQQIEDVRRLAGKTVIVSFWAACNSGTPKMGVSIDQTFGTGGSPSPTVTGVGQAVTLSTTWTRYSLTFVVPSVNGKVFGTALNNATTLRFWMSSGANFNVRAGGIGMQTHSPTLWGVQLEIAQPGQTQPTLLEKPDPVMQLQQCQRFYQVGSFGLQGNATATATTVGYCQTLGVSMHHIPTTALASESNAISMSTRSIVADSASQIRPNGTAANAFVWTGTFTASADL
jgi:hypothetical protein